MADSLEQAAKKALVAMEFAVEAHRMDEKITRPRKWEYTDDKAREAIAALRSALHQEERERENAEEFVRMLLWDNFPECCGQPVVGAEYMGQQEMICCGNPESALLSDAQIVAALRERFTFCEHCGGNDENPPDHCADCANPTAAIATRQGTP